MLFPPELPPDQCPSHPIKFVSHPIDCYSYPLLDDWDEDDYDSSLENEEDSLTEVEHGRHQPASIGMLHLPSALLWPLSFPFAVALPQ